MPWRRICQFTVAIFVLAAMCSTAAGGVIRHDRPDAAYLNLGADAAYACVGRLDYTVAGQGDFGSATLIAPDWVLTAGHCVRDAGTASFTVGGQTYAAARWLAHASYTGNLLAGYDIGLVQLRAPVQGVAPAQRYAGSAELGQLATFVGYGMTGTGKTGATTLDGLKRAGQNVIDELHGPSAPDARLFEVDFDDPGNPKTNYLGASQPVDLEYLIGPGDSGGGVFISSPSGPVLAGVSSFRMARDGRADSSYGDTSGHIRVSAFNGWIDAVLSGWPLAGLPLEGNLTSLVPADIQAPEPAAGALLTLGGLALLGRRRHFIVRE